MGKGYTVTTSDDATDWMAGYEGFGEMLSYTQASGSEQVAFTWRRMPPDTGGRGSYAHRHPGQEEIYLVVSGTATFKVGDDVFEAGPRTAVRMTSEEPYSVHNDTDEDVHLVLISTRNPDATTEKTPEGQDFWSGA